MLGTGDADAVVWRYERANFRVRITRSRPPSHGSLSRATPRLGRPQHRSRGLVAEGVQVAIQGRDEADPEASHPVRRLLTGLVSRIALGVRLVRPVGTMAESLSTVVEPPSK